MSQRITVAYGDGIGPEIMQVVLDILKKAGADFEMDVVEMGEKVYLKGHQSGIKPEDWETLRKNKIFLKAPITTPQGGGYKSLNVKVRKSLGLFANVRPVRSLYPYVPTHFPKMDVCIIRENEEDLYAGIEHRQTDEVFQCLKLMSLSGCEKISRYAFEYARSQGRKKVTCMTKDNIMKLTDGTFKKVFEKVAKEYPEIESEHWIIDIGAAKFSTDPENFDVILLPNLYGDVLSDISAMLAGSVGIGGSSNIGVSHAMFEAIHGSAPRRAGQNVANPSGLLSGACLMLSHMGETGLSQKIQNAWLKTIEEGLHTYDIFSKETSKEKLSTTDFGKAVIENLGGRPKNLPEIKLPKKTSPISIKLKKDFFKKEKKERKGVDVFICKEVENQDTKVITNKLAEDLKKAEKGGLKLSFITNRGIKVYPDPLSETFCVDHWRCRFLKEEDKLSQKEILKLLSSIEDQGLEIIKTENLYSFDSNSGFSSIG